MARSANGAGPGTRMAAWGREIDALLASSHASRWRAGLLAGGEAWWGGRRLSVLRAAFRLSFVAIVCVGALPAHAVEVVNVRQDVAAIDLTAAVERQRTESDRILVSAAP